MTYDEWLATLKRLEKNSFTEDVLKVTSEPTNENLKSFIVPKLLACLRTKFNYSVSKIKENLDLLYEDENELDLELVNFKKSITTIISLLNNKQLSQKEMIDNYNKLKEDTDEVYEILLKQADRNDDTGVTSSIIKRNRIKWSD